MLKRAVFNAIFFSFLLLFHLVFASLLSCCLDFFCASLLALFPVSFFFYVSFFWMCSSFFFLCAFFFFVVAASWPSQGKPSQSQSQASTSKRDQGTRGPRTENPRSRGAGDWGTRGPGDPGTRAPQGAPDLGRGKPGTPMHGP